jgi:hypothetical protein
MKRVKGISIKGLLLLCLVWLITGCSGIASRKAGLQLGLDDIQVDEEAVGQAMTRIAVSPALSREDLSEALKILFSFLVQTPPDQLVETKPHAEARWQLDKIYLLDDCVAVQFAEGHYMETIFWVRNRTGWRMAGRIRPEDHQ